MSQGEKRENNTTNVRFQVLLRSHRASTKNIKERLQEKKKKKFRATGQVTGQVSNSDQTKSVYSPVAAVLYPRVIEPRGRRLGLGLLLLLHCYDSRRRCCVLHLLPVEASASLHALELVQVEGVVVRCEGLHDAVFSDENPCKSGTRHVYLHTRSRYRAI